MVYDSGFSTRRTYSSRPVVSSYTVSYPTLSRVYRTSYPIYSSYTIRRPVITGTRVITSPFRVITSPVRYVTRIERSPTPVRYVTRISRSPSPVRITRTTERIITSPERVISYSYTSPSTYYSPSIYAPYSYYSSPYISPKYYHYTPSYYSPITHTYISPWSSVRAITSPIRSTTPFLKRIPPGYGMRQLTNYLGTEPFDTFRAETGRIRHRAQSLMRDLHTPVVRRARSATPFPVSIYGPSSQLALDAYISRMTDPIRHVAKEVHGMDLESPRRHFVNDLDPARPTRKFCTSQSDEAVENEAKERRCIREKDLQSIDEEIFEPEKEEALHQDEADRSKNMELECKRNARQSADEEKLHEEEMERLAKIEQQAREKREAEHSRELAEKARLAEESRLIEEARRAQAEKEQKHREAEIKRQAEIEQRAREEREAELAEEARQAEEARLVEEARLAEEARLIEEARLAEEAHRAQVEEEQKLREEEIKRLAEIEQQAKEEQEAEQARQASELAEIARQETQIAIKEIQEEANNIEVDNKENDSSFIGYEPIISEPFSPIEAGKEPIIELTSNIIAEGEGTDEDCEEEYDEEES